MVWPFCSSDSVVCILRCVFAIVVLLMLGGCGGGSGESGNSSAPASQMNVSFSITVAETYVNDSVELSWSSSTGGSCTASGDWSGSRASSGTESVPTDISGDFSFTISCSNANATVSKTVDLKLVDELIIDYENQAVSISEDEIAEIEIDLATTSRAPLSTIVYRLTTNPQNGSVVVTDNLATYTPDSDFFGSDVFQITATAENQRATSIVSITVSGVNDPPQISIENPEGYVSDNLPIFVSQGLIKIPYSVSDSDNDISDLTFTAFLNGQQVPMVLTTESIELNLGQDFFSGRQPIQIMVTDGGEEASSQRVIWLAETLSEPSDGPRVNVLLGNPADFGRGFNYVLILHDIAPGSVRDAAYGGLTYYFEEFLSDEDSRRQRLIDSLFNVYVVDFPLGVDSGVIVETGCYEDSPETYCVEDAADSVSEFLAANVILEDVEVNTVSIITGLEGRGVNFGDVNIQPLLGESNGSFGGPNRMLKTLKHEFGHAFQYLGDHYTSDFLLEDASGKKLIDMSDGIERMDAYNADITAQEDPYSVKWKHLYDDIESIPGKDTTDDKSNSAVGYWAGCYFHDKYCFRSSYNSIMNGDYSAYNELLDFDSNRTGYSHTSFDVVGAEAFALSILQKQGLNSIYAELDDNGDLFVGHRINLPSSLFAIDWYLDGILIEEWDSSIAKKLSGAELEDENGSLYVERVKVPKGAPGSFTSVAYRVRELGSNPLIKATDAIDIYGDVYLGIFSTRVGVFSCAENEGYWTETGTTFCNSTLSIRFADGWQYSPNWPTRDRLLADRGADLYYLYEDSGLGSQFLINWDYFQ